MSKTFGVVLVTYNRKKLLIEAVQSLLDQTVQPQKIIIVDNASTDGTIAELISNFDVFNNKLFDILQLPENVGGAGGFKAGLEKMSELDIDFVSISDDDAIYKEDYFEKILELSKENPQARAFCGKVSFEDGSIQLTHKKRVLHSKSLLNDCIVAPEEYDKKSFEVDVVSFVGLVIENSLVHEIGLPLSEYFIWLDDFEYSLRIREKSNIICIPSAVIIHKTSKSVTNKKFQYTWKEYYGFRNEIDLVKRHTKHPIISNLALEWKFWSRLVANFIMPKYAECRTKRAKTLMQGRKDGRRGILGKNTNYLPG